MERKLQDLKEEFCKWYCPNKDIVINPNENCDKEIYCEECNTYILCEQFNGFIEPCEQCQIDEYIRYIRDQLK